MILLIIALFSYLIGSIPSGYLVAKSQGIDIRQHGSKNIGATNVLRVMGKKWGYLVFFCDSFKGFASVKLGALVAEHALLSPVLGSVIAAIACILGHNYTIWLRFKGGKGIATSGGVGGGLVPGTGCSLRRRDLVRSFLCGAIRFSCFDRGRRSVAVRSFSRNRQKWFRFLDPVRFFGPDWSTCHLAAPIQHRTPSKGYGVKIRQEIVSEAVSPIGAAPNATLGRGPNQQDCKNGAGCSSLAP
jgi:hypothetical protein